MTTPGQLPPLIPAKAGTQAFLFGDIDPLPEFREQTESAWNDHFS